MSRDVTHRKGTRRSYRKLEEPIIPFILGKVVECKSVPADEAVAIVASVRQAVTDEVEADSSKASIQQILQNNVLCVL